MASYSAFFKEDKMQELTDLPATLAWAKLKPEAWASVKKELGEDFDDLETVAAIPNGDYATAVAEIKPPLGAIQRTRLSLFVNAARAKMGTPIVELFQSEATPPPRVALEPNGTGASPSICRETPWCPGQQPADTGDKTIACRITSTRPCASWLRRPQSRCWTR